MQIKKLTSNILCSERNVNVEQLLYSQRVALLVAHHWHVIKSVEIRQSLGVSFVLDEFFRATMKEANVWICSEDSLQKLFV